MSKALSDLQKEYKRLAKRADQRMRELERAQAKEEYQHILEWSYARAQDDLTALFGEDVTRFDRKISDKRKLNKALASVKAFLNSETSTIGKAKGIDGVGEVSGIKIMFEDRAQKFNRWIENNTDEDFNLSTDEFIDFVQNQKYQKLRQKYRGSDVILRRITSAAKYKDEIKMMIAKEQHRAQSKVTDRMFYNYVLRIIEKKGLNAAIDLV